MEIFLTIVYVLLFIFIINKVSFFTVGTLSRKVITLVFLSKVVAGIVLWAIYNYYYNDRFTSDIFRYFDDSRVLFDALKTNPVDYFKMLFGIGNSTTHFKQYYDEMNNWYRTYDSNIFNGSHAMIRLNALFRLFSFGYFQVHTIFMCFISLVGTLLIYKTLLEFLKVKEQLLKIALFITPSFVFWGSGVLKEGIIIFGTGLCMHSFLSLLFDEKKLLPGFLFAFSLCLLFFVKFYTLVSLFPALMAMGWSLKVNNQKIIQKYLIIFTLYFMAGVAIKYAVPKYDPFQILYIKQKDFLRLLNENNAQIQSKITTYTIDNSIASFLISAPKALFTSFITPNFWQEGRLLLYFSSIENACLLAFVLLAIIYRKKIVGGELNLFLFGISFSAVLYVIIGLISPFAGAIVRYKSAVLPFFLLSFLLLVNTDKLQKIVTLRTKKK